MKILRTDNQGICQTRVYDSYEELRLQLIDFHSIDWDCETDINSLTLDEICNYGDWEYKRITNKEAKEYELNEELAYEL